MRRTVLPQIAAGLVSAPLLVHGTAVALDGGAVLLRGPSGAGKSDLALRLIDQGARLVADDQVLLRRDGERVLARAPDALAGLIEIRGLGIVAAERIDDAPLVLLVDQVGPAGVERLPAAAVESVLGIAIARLALAPFEASATAKLRLAARTYAATSRSGIITR